MSEASDRSDPVLSIVVTLVDGGDVMRRFLDAVTQQDDPPPLDIVLPYDASVADVADLAADYPLSLIHI